MVRGGAVLPTCRSADGLAAVTFVVERFVSYLGHRRDYAGAQCTSRVGLIAKPFQAQVGAAGQRGAAVGIRRIRKHDRGRAGWHPIRLVRNDWQGGIVTQQQDPVASWGDDRRTARAANLRLPARYGHRRQLRRVVAPHQRVPVCEWKELQALIELLSQDASLPLAAKRDGAHGRVEHRHLRYTHGTTLEFAADALHFRHRGKNGLASGNS